MFPITCRVNGQWAVDLGAEAELKPKIPGLSLKVDAKTKNTMRKDAFAIYAGRTSDFIQWLFLENWIKEKGDFKLEVLCLVAKSLPENMRRFFCDVEFKDNDRILASVHNKKIMLPI
jgi:hypothetical protein